MLRDAVGEGDLAKVTRLLDEEADVDIEVSWNTNILWKLIFSVIWLKCNEMSSLICADERGHKDIVPLPRDKGAECDESNSLSIFFELIFLRY